MNKQLILSHVNHGDKTFFVSTINRQSSSMDGGTYAETMAWEFDQKTKERLGLVGQQASLTNSLSAHFRVCKKLFETGNCEEEDAL